MTRVALVTGAAQGIGRRIAGELAGSGWSVAMCDRDPAVSTAAEGIAAEGFTALPLVFDVTDEGSVRDAFLEVGGKLGEVSAVVSNAAIVDHIDLAEGMSADGWRNEIEVNLTGAFFVLRAAIPSMKASRTGRLVLVSSAAAVDGLRGQVAYTASKAGLLGMMRTLASELAPFGITVNSILPGMVETEKVRAMPEEVRVRAMEMIPAGRFAAPEEIAAAVRFLVGPGAGFITGESLRVDGGAGLSQLALGGVAARP